MKFQWGVIAFLPLLLSFRDYGIDGAANNAGNQQLAGVPAKEIESCNGVFTSYQFISRTKEYPYLKNATAQSWAFNATATILNTGIVEISNWQMFIGFQHREILVSAGGGTLLDSSDFPADVSNGTYITGSALSTLKTSIETAGDINQIGTQIQLVGTQFGVRPPAIPMPKTINLIVDGFKCPAPTTAKTTMYVCCIKDPKHKNVTKAKFLKRQKGDLSITYDILQAYESSYFAQVTIDNDNPLGRLDHWNLTFEWMKGEFIYSMKGAYTHLMDYADCVLGPPGQYYQQMDFSKVMNCQKNPIISDLPREKAEDPTIGQVPYCCRNGSLVPNIMDPSQARSVFQMQVYKMPPSNRTSFDPPQKWKLVGDLNPNYKCGPPIKVAPTEFPDTNGLQAVTLAIATWQIVCNITRPAKRTTKCCVSFSAYYNESVVPCDTCACGCPDPQKCNPNAPALLLPPQALLVPFVNRSAKAIAWAKLKKRTIHKPMPCPDNCGVSINWHISGNYRNGWTARITLFNWEKMDFANWFTAIQFKKAGRGFEQAYSFNGTLLNNTHDNTVFLQGIPGMNYLIGIKNGSNHEKDPQVPGKQQSIISFTKKNIRHLQIVEGDGFPSRVYFNGEECAIPSRIPKRSNGNCIHVNLLQAVVLALVSFLLVENHQ